MNAIDDYGQVRRCGETFAQRLSCWRQAMHHAIRKPAQPAAPNRPNTQAVRYWLP